jgi:Tn3 transposase DDE domain
VQILSHATSKFTLNGLARHRINTRLIATHWDDILRVAGSLKVGTVHASILIQALQRGGRPTTLARAISELGRIAKTLYLLLCWLLGTSVQKDGVDLPVFRFSGDFLRTDVPSSQYRARMSRMFILHNLTEC